MSCNKMLFVIFVVTHTLDSALSHLGVAIDVSVWETSTLHKEDFHAKQQNCQSHQNYSQNQYLHGRFVKKACKFKKGF